MVRLFKHDFSFFFLFKNDVGGQLGELRAKQGIRRILKGISKANLGSSRVI